MNANYFRQLKTRGISAAIGIASLTFAWLHAEVVVDGNALAGDGYTTIATQAHATAWSQNALGNLRCVQVRNTLHVFIAGRVGNNAMILFVESKAGGVNRITPNLINPQSNGEEAYINQLALNESQGMTFESGFNPNMAIRIYGNEVSGVKSALVNRFDFTNGTHSYSGDSHAATVSDGPIRALKTDWRTVPTSTTSLATFTYGVEIALNLSDLGVAPGAQSVQLSAILVNPASSSGSNQVLGSLSQGFAMGGGDVTAVNFETEPGTQNLTFAVTGLDPALDQDDDGLANGVETGTGSFVSAGNTGSDPYLNDSDSDGYLDGLEVAGTSGLGYASDPNLPNYTNMGVPGSFNLPSPWQPVSASNTPGTAMSQESTSLTGQYHWILDYKFSTQQLGPFDHKFTTNGSFVTQWGLSAFPGTIKRNGNNIAGYVPATGFHRFYFDQAAMTYTFGRRVFADSAAFLAAYALAAGADGDNDGIPNENEFAANTDPTNSDSDGDGLNDLTDSQPLLAARDIVFSVDMHIQAVNGEFTPGVHTVKVVFFSGNSAPGELALSDPDGDGIHTGTLIGAQGPTGSSFGEYKFQTTLNSGTYEDFISNRTFDLGPAHTPQVLPTVFFNDLPSSYAYNSWAESFSSHPGPPAEDSDGDTFTNHEEFLFGSSPIERTSALTSMEQTGGFLILRWLQRLGGATYQLQESATLADNPWPASTASVEDDPDQSGLSGENYVRKTASVPIDQARKFVRISGQE